MKSIRDTFRAMQAHNKALCFTYALVLIVLLAVLGAERAHAQSGNIYAGSQAQAVGNVYDAVVLQVAIKEVEATPPARAAGAGVGAAAGLLLAVAANPEHRGAANTVGALLGGLFGERTANVTMRTAAQEIIVRYTSPNGLPRTVVILQPEPFDQVFPLEAVYLSEVRGAYRVLKRMQ